MLNILFINRFIFIKKSEDKWGRAHVIDLWYNGLYKSELADRLGVVMEEDDILRGKVKKKIKGLVKVVFVLKAARMK